MIISTWLIACYFSDLVYLGGYYESGLHWNQCKDLHDLTTFSNVYPIPCIIVLLYNSMCYFV